VQTLFPSASSLTQLSQTLGLVSKAGRVLACNTAWTWAGERFGFASITRAATPAIKGVAADVPPKPLEAAIGSEATIPTPGASRSKFGPQLENDARAPVSLDAQAPLEPGIVNIAYEFSVIRP